MACPPVLGKSGPFCVKDANGDKLFEAVIISETWDGDTGALLSTQAMDTSTSPYTPISLPAGAVMSTCCCDKPAALVDPNGDPLPMDLDGNWIVCRCPVTPSGAPYPINASGEPQIGIVDATGAPYPFDIATGEWMIANGLTKYVQGQTYPAGSTPNPITVAIPGGTVDVAAGNPFPADMVGCVYVDSNGVSIYTDASPPVGGFEQPDGTAAEPGQAPNSICVGSKLFPPNPAGTSGVPGVPAGWTGPYIGPDSAGNFAPLPDDDDVYLQFDSANNVWIDEDGEEIAPPVNDVNGDPIDPDTTYFIDPVTGEWCPKGAAGGQCLDVVDEDGNYYVFDVDGGTYIPVGDSPATPVGTPTVYCPTGGGSSEIVYCDGSPATVVPDLESVRMTHDQIVTATTTVDDFSGFPASDWNFIDTASGAVTNAGKCDRRYVVHGGMHADLNMSDSDERTFIGASNRISYDGGVTFTALMHNYLSDSQTGLAGSRSRGDFEHPCLTSFVLAPGATQTIDIASAARWRPYVTTVTTPPSGAETVIEALDVCVDIIGGLA